MKSIKSILAITSLILFCNTAAAQIAISNTVRAFVKKNINEVIEPKDLNGEVPCLLNIKSIETLNFYQIDTTYEGNWSNQKYTSEEKKKELSNKLLSVHMIQNIEYISNYENKIIVTVLDEDKKYKNYDVKYPSEKEALAGLKKILQAMHTCKKES
jgi:hypothetical protein